MSTVPGWFDLHDYNFIKNLTFDSLAVQLSIRRYIRLNIQSEGYSAKNYR